MFTGIIEETGYIKEMSRQGMSRQVTIACRKILDDIKIGDSISSNGVCLTVTKFNSVSFTADIMPETVNLSTFSQLGINSKINLERALKVDGRFGGHMVAGHIDGTARIERIERDENAYRFYLQSDSRIMRYIIRKGSVAIDGVSLTVSKSDSRGFEVSVIPQTMKESNFSSLKRSSLVNIETDLVGRYLEKFINNNSGITKGFLSDNGFL